MRTFALIFIAFILTATRTATAQRGHSEVREVARPIPIPPCSGGTLCLMDSTRLVDDECCDISAYSEWLLLPPLGDSIELYAVTPQDLGATPFVTLRQPGRHRSWQEHLPGLSAPFLRQRFRELGSYVVRIDLSAVEPSAGMPYELRVRTIGSKSVLKSAPIRLHLVGGQNVSFIVRPHGGGVVGEPSDYTVPAGVYRVLAPGTDSVDVCRKPCRRTTVVSLAQSAARIAR